MAPGSLLAARLRQYWEWLLGIHRGCTKLYGGYSAAAPPGSVTRGCGVSLQAPGAATGRRCVRANIECSATNKVNFLFWFRCLLYVKDAVGLLACLEDQRLVMARPMERLLDREESKRRRTGGRRRSGIPHQRGPTVNSPTGQATGSEGGGGLRGGDTGAPDP